MLQIWIEFNFSNFETQIEPIESPSLNALLAVHFPRFSFHGYQFHLLNDSKDTLSSHAHSHLFDGFCCFIVAVFFLFFFFWTFKSTRWQFENTKCWQFEHRKERFSNCSLNGPLHSRLKLFGACLTAVSCCDKFIWNREKKNNEE